MAMVDVVVVTQEQVPASNVLAGLGVATERATKIVEVGVFLAKSLELR
jgi:hypothetical protein